MKSGAIKPVVLSTFLFLANAAPGAQTTAEKKPLTKSQVYDLVASGLESQRIVNAVEQRGIDFTPSEGYLEALAKKGANQALLDALRAATPTPLSKSDLVHLLAAGKTSQSVQAMVERRRIDFRPTDEDLDTLRIAGATEGLLKAVREAGDIGETFSVGGKVTAPIPIYSPDPPCSDEARKAGLSGTVVVQIIVDTAGNVRDVKVVKPLGHGLDGKAIETIRNWQFKPALRDGIPVTCACWLRSVSGSLVRLRKTTPVLNPCRPAARFLSL